MFCIKCGKNLSPDAKFCDACGQAVVSNNVEGEQSINQQPMGVNNNVMQQPAPEVNNQPIDEPVNINNVVQPQPMGVNNNAMQQPTPEVNNQIFNEPVNTNNVVQPQQSENTVTPTPVDTTNNNSQLPPKTKNNVNIMEVVGNFIKKFKKVIIAIVVIIVLLIIIKAIGSSGSSTGTSVLPSSKNSYAKVCTLSQDYEVNEGSSAKIDMTFGIYEKDGKVMQDTVIVWSKKSGKITIPSGSSADQIVSSFATLTGMSFRFNGTKSNVNNYYKNGKIYITNTITYESSEFASIDALVKDYQDKNNAKCK